MSAASRLACVEVPRRLRTRPRDARGYPVPWIVVVDRTGRPHFPINDAGRVLAVVRKRLCGLCGKRLDNGAWFVGGQRCFLHPRGAFLDPACHEDCARYALAVCPYLAASSYARRLDDRAVDPAQLPEGVRIVADDTMAEARPDLFMLGRTVAYGTVPAGPGQFYIRAEQEWTGLEVWRHGKLVDPEVARALPLPPGCAWPIDTVHCRA